MRPTAMFSAVGVLTAIAEPEKTGAYLTGVDRCRFRRPVLPGDQLHLEVEILSVRMRVGKCRAVARVDGQLCAEPEISSVLVDRS